MEGDLFSGIVLISRPNISIHSLRMEGDCRLRHNWKPLPLFQSTPSAWRETHPVTDSKHTRSYFNPLPPHGGRLVFPVPLWRPINFNPLPPHGGRQHPLRTIPRRYAISIHSLRMEGDTSADAAAIAGCNFNPLPPHGGRLENDSGYTLVPNISIHSLRMEGDARSGSGL